MTHESPIERQIREALEREDLAKLPGAGKPLDLDDDPQWWARKFVERERLRDEVVEMAARVRRELPVIVAEPDDGIFEERIVALVAAVDEVKARAGALADDLPTIDVDAINLRRAGRRR